METNNQQLCGLSRNRTLSCRIELLNTSYNIVDTLEGKVTNGTITLSNNRSSSNDSSNDNSNFARITGNMEFILSYDLAKDYFKLDLQHFIRTILILEDNVSGTTAEYSFGICIINSPNIVKGIDGNSKISIDLNDLMSNYCGDFGGSLSNKVLIEGSSTSNLNLSQTINDIATNSSLMNLSSDKVMCETNSYEILSEITCEAGNNITDLLKSLMDLYKGYELFFNQDGVLVYQKIKQYKTDSPIQEYNNSPNIISYTVKKNFTNVRNDIVVLGCTETDENNNNVGIQYRGEAKLEDINHPLCISKIGDKKKVISDDKQLTKDSCQSEAEYWLDRYTNYAETLEISIIPDFRLIPNRVIKIAYNDDDILIDGRYLINSVQFGLKPSDLSTVNCSLIYDYVS